MGSKLIRGSLIIFIGNIIFRIGGYIYRFLMATLLGPAMFGILGIAIQFQGIFQTLSAGGLPPAIAKYVAEYNTLDEKDMARQTMYTALKIMLVLGVVLGIIMIFIVAPWLVNVYLKNKPEALIPLQIVGLITPFSVIVGAFRGAFQGVYKMEYILYTRAVEQLGMIIFATLFILIGFSVIGAMWGTVLGFVISSLLAVYIFNNWMEKYIPKANSDFKFSRRNEFKLAMNIVKFSIPVIVTAIAEMGIYTICTLVMGRFLASKYIGYFISADPIARLPLMISISVATTILPASSAAFVSKNKKSLEKYVTQSYKYSMLFVIPMCIGISLFAAPILRVFYFTNSAYMLGASALSILVIGMTFYSIFAISTSIVQGIGNPRIPMYILIVGAFVTLILNWYMVPAFGIAGGAAATTIACLIMMIPIVYFVFKLTETRPPFEDMLKIISASFIMGAFAFIIPKNPLGLLVGIIICPIIYLFSLSLLKVFTKYDIKYIRSYSSKFGPLKVLVNKILSLIEKIEFR